MAKHDFHFPETDVFGEVVCIRAFGISMLSGKYGTFENFDTRIFGICVLRQKSNIAKILAYPAMRGCHDIQEKRDIHKKSRYRGILEFSCYPVKLDIGKIDGHSEVQDFHDIRQKGDTGKMLRFLQIVGFLETKEKRDIWECRSAHLSSLATFVVI